MDGIAHVEASADRITQIIADYHLEEAIVELTMRITNDEEKVQAASASQSA
jgi:hypothetical protein